MANRILWVVEVLLGGEWATEADGFITEDAAHSYAYVAQQHSDHSMRVRRYIGSERTRDMAHTPGPWKFVSGHSKHGPFIADHRAPTIDDARLIAAAPDLLGALKGTYAELLSVLTAINEDRMPHDGDEFHERLESARAAIAKAEGREDR